MLRIQKIKFKNQQVQEESKDQVRPLMRNAERSKNEICKTIYSPKISDKN